MKKYLIIFLIPFMMLASCMEDKSAYLPQDKEDVKVDDITPDDGGEEEEEPVDGVLTPGVHLLKMTVNGVERKFKYYMPVSISDAKPISVIFSFHSAYEVKEGEEIPDPLEGITSSYAFNQLAIKENCIVIYPAGNLNVDRLDWSKDNYNDNLLFVDEIVNHLKKCTPIISTDHIYAVGYSEGGTFATVLALHRPEVFAAISPIAGIRFLKDDATIPSRSVNMIMMLGSVDPKDDPNSSIKPLKYKDVVAEVDVWSEKIGGYFLKDLIVSKDPFEVDKYNKKVETRKYNNGKADIEVYSVLDEKIGNVSMTYMSKYIWDFFKAHPLTKKEILYVSARDTMILAKESERFEIPYSYTNGATATVDAPSDWSPVIENNTIKLTAPSSYENAENVLGTIAITVTKGGVNKVLRIPYKLNIPKTIFEVGDIYYNSDNKPVGVVVWVNSKNRREAKIVNLEYSGAYETIHFNTRPIGADFETPDRNDGVGNTAALVAQNGTIAKPNVASESAYVWANTYVCQGVSDWYLPAINEWAAIASNFDLINTAIASIGGKPLAKVKYYSSTTELVDADAKTKNFYYFNFSTNKEEKKVVEDEYTAYNAARIMKKVTK